MKQLLIVITDSFNSINGTLFAFEGSSETAAFSCPVALGKKGMAWGRGVHNYWLLSGPHKQEGDQKAPAGLFALSSLFGKERHPEMKMPFLETSTAHRCVDDPRSAFYNVIVHKEAVTKDWNSAEEMVRSDGLYDLGIVIDHNADPVTPHMGSCIFMHQWRGERQGSAGCTVMAKADLECLTLWLDESKDPHLLQLPREGYLPFLSALRSEPHKTTVTKRLGRLMRA